jgi:hypothetical protein
MDAKPGEVATCSQCGRDIVFIGPYWDHPGEIKPKHPAIPVTETPKPQPPQWMAQLDERTNKHIAFARHYAANFAHGAPGHLDLLTIAKLAELLDAQEAAHAPV